MQAKHRVLVTNQPEKSVDCLRFSVDITQNSGRTSRRVHAHQHSRRPARTDRKRRPLFYQRTVLLAFDRSQLFFYAA